MLKEMKILINTMNDDKQKKVDKLLKQNLDRFFTNYSILAIALEENLENVTIDEIEKFHQVNISRLNETDKLIVAIIKTLEKLTGEDVRQEYFNKFTLDISQPELKYLIDLIVKEG